MQFQLHTRLPTASPARDRMMEHPSFLLISHSIPSQFNSLSSSPALVGAVRVREDLPGGLDAPDLAAVLGDGAVRAELAGGGDVQDRHLGPALLVLQHGKARRVEGLASKSRKSKLSEVCCYSTSNAQNWKKWTRKKLIPSSFSGRILHSDQRLPNHWSEILPFPTSFHPFLKYTSWHQNIGILLECFFLNQYYYFYLIVPEDGKRLNISFLSPGMPPRPCPGSRCRTCSRRACSTGPSGAASGRCR